MLGRTKVILSVLAAGALVAGLLQTPLLATVRETLWSTLITVVGQWSRVGPLEYDAAATDQLAGLRAENIRLKSELKDYAVLRQQLQQPAVGSLRSIEAVVTGAPVDVFRTHLLLNRGALDGVVLGAPVVIEGSILLGFISELGEHTAVCQLLFHPATSIPAEVLDTDQGRGLLTGSLYTSLVLNTIPRDAKLEAGQAVVTVAHEITPPALLVGTVDRVYSEENEAYQQARLLAPYDPDNIRAVTILVQP